MRKVLHTLQAIKVHHHLTMAKQSDSKKLIRYVEHPYTPLSFKVTYASTHNWLIVKTL